MKEHTIDLRNNQEGNENKEKILMPPKLEIKTTKEFLQNCAHNTTAIMERIRTSDGGFKEPDEKIFEKT